MSDRRAIKLVLTKPGSLPHSKTDRGSRRFPWCKPSSSYSCIQVRTCSTLALACRFSGHDRLLDLSFLPCLAGAV